MPNSLKYEDILSLKNKILIDVRTPSEYNETTIPGAINIPVLLDDERIEVGTLYSNKKIDEAKTFAVNSISKRLSEIFTRFINLSKKYENIVVFCARGGYRSKSISSFLNSLDVSVIRIDGGYKSYRNYVLDNMELAIKNITPIVLYGNTGCGKTKILEELKLRNHPVIDLEGLAIHRGSMLGAVGLSEQPTQKMFENLLFEELSRFTGKYIFLEGESKRIGKVHLPESLYDKMAEFINIKISSPIDYRVGNLVEEYANPNNKEAIGNAIKRMSKFMSNAFVEDLLSALEIDDYSYVAKELCLNYYDKKYKNRVTSFDFELINDNIKNITSSLESLLKSTLDKNNI